MLLIKIIEISSAVLLVIAILIQNKGAGIGSAFGGGDGNVTRSKRGAEKGLFITTIILAIIFLAASFANFLL